MHIGNYELNENETAWCLEEAEAVLARVSGHWTQSLNHKFKKEDVVEFLSWIWKEKPEATELEFDEDEKEED